MAKSASKRNRKERDKFALKQKGERSHAVTDVNALLSDELRNEDFAQQVLIQRKRPKSGVSGSNSQLPAPQKVLSKSEERKLKQIVRQKQAQAKVKDAIASLSASKLDDAALSILSKTSNRGGKVTAKQRLRREKALHGAGVDLPTDSHLFRSVPNVQMRDDHVTPGQSHPEGSSIGSSHDDATHPLHGGIAQDTRGETHVTGLSSALRSRELSQRAPPTNATFGRATVEAMNTQLQTELQKHAKDEGSSAANEAGPAVNADPMRVAEELRSQMIASGDIKVADEAEPAPGQPRSVPSLGPARHRAITRPPEIQSARMQLPILAMEQEIMAMVDEHDVFLLCGATGCGKTTQVPQFLAEGGFGCAEFPEKSGIVGVTQPRRVAAVSTARRVAEEVGQTGIPAIAGSTGMVGYQVRHDKALGADAALKFMTDGILMREVQEDFLLTRYSVIIIDEAHERSLNTDLLIGMLSRIVPQRRAMNQAGKVRALPGLPSEPATLIQPLKLIIMSATLRVDDFLQNVRLFPGHLYPAGPPPLVNVPARQFPVTVHFSKRTEMDDYVGAVYHKTLRIHRELPPGGILVFVTGQREVQQLCKRLQAAFPSPLQNNPKVTCGETVSADESNIFDLNGADRAEVEANVLQENFEEPRSLELRVDDDEFDLSDIDADEEETLQLGESGMSPADITMAEEYFEHRYGLRCASSPQDSRTAPAAHARDDKEQHEGVGVRAPLSLQGARHAPVHVLPLYAMLLPQEQRKAFEDPPEGHRLIVVATNVAETSLTIPGIRYVVDAGRSKTKLLEDSSGINHYEVRWISQASADQRAGRAGRTGPGHCYRLFSSAVFTHTFPKFAPPEISNIPLDGVVLSMHALGLPKVVNFPFPSPPSEAALRSAEQCLLCISALRVKSCTVAVKTASGSDLELTPLGRAMAAFPISPRHSRMILAAAEFVVSRRQVSVNPVQHALALAAALSSESPFLEADSVAMVSHDTDANPARSQDASVCMRNRVHSAHQRLRDPQSDAMSALNALIAFEAEPEESADVFCKKHFLHATHLREMSALRAQLCRVVGRPSSRHASWADLQRVMETSIENSGLQRGHLQSPNKRIREALRCCIASGWADQISKRVRSRAQLEKRQVQGKGTRAVRYQSCSHDAELYMHPRSFMYKQAPDYVVYLGLTRTEKRTYMRTMTSVEPGWLVQTGPAMCDVSAPVPNVAPSYDKATDQVMAWCHASYGVHSWPLPMHKVVHPDETERCAHFAAALLAGAVLPVPSKLLCCLNVKPTQIASQSGRALHRVAALIAALLEKGVDNSQKLRAQWLIDGDFLKREVLALLQKGALQLLDGAWPSLTCPAGALS